MVIKNSRFQQKVALNLMYSTSSIWGIDVYWQAMKYQIRTSVNGGELIPLIMGCKTKLDLKIWCRKRWGLEDTKRTCGGWKLNDVGILTLPINEDLTEFNLVWL